MQTLRAGHFGVEREEKDVHMNEKTRAETTLDRWANKMDFVITERVGVVTLAQEKGALTPNAEVRLKASLRARNPARKFSSVHIRSLCCDGPYDVRPDGEIVQGFIRVLDGELEVAFMVPASQFLSFALETNLTASSEVIVAVWPFEDLSTWNGETALLLRKIEILSVSSVQ